jgi:hypothetical protein
LLYSKELSAGNFYHYNPLNNLSSKLLGTVIHSFFEQ